MGLTEETAKVAVATVDAMRGSPVTIALALVNVMFLVFCGYVLGEVAANAAERNKSQLQLINDLVHDIRDCRQGPKP